MTETLHRTPERATTDHERQSPEQFIQSMAIFDSYVPVSEYASNDPESQNGFNAHEQELVEGVRGTLEQMARTAEYNRQSVSIDELFDEFNMLLLASDMDSELRDELFVVAEKMQYHLQLRYDRTQAGNDEYIPAPSTEMPAFSDFNTVDDLFKSLPDDPTRESAYDQNQVTETIETPSEVRDYAREAADIITKRTDGQLFSDLDSKTQTKLIHGLAKEYHPDVPGRSEDLYKEITAQTAQNNGTTEYREQ